MIELHVTYTMKPGIRPKAFYDALNAATIPETCRQEKGNIRYHYFLPVDNDNQLFLLEICLPSKISLLKRQIVFAMTHSNFPLYI